jgi:hypothetical protein
MLRTCSRSLWSVSARVGVYNRGYAVSSLAAIKQKWVCHLSRFTIYTKDKNDRLVFSEEVEHALEKKQPIVALESAIITHGKFPSKDEFSTDI